MPQGHDQCVLYIIKNLIFEFCLNRENINAQEQIRDQEHRAAYEHEFAYRSVYRHADPQVCGKEKADEDKSDPYKSGLAEVLAERAVEVAGSVPLSCADTLHAAIVQRCG